MTSASNACGSSIRAAARICGMPSERNPTMSAPTLYGLLLTGGRSTRMKRDKARLEYAGKPQLDRAMALIAPLVSRAFVSVRAEQRDDPQRTAYETITDLRKDLGPLGGIQA